MAVKRLSINTFWQLVSKAINAASGLLILGMIARSFGDRGIGHYSLAIGYITLFFMPVDFGLNAIAVKDMLDNQKKQSHVFLNLLAVRLLLSAVILLFALVISLFLPYNLQSDTGYSQLVKTGIFLVSLAIPAQAILSTANAYFQATQRYYLQTFTNLCSAIANALIVYLGIQTTSLNLTYLALSISGLLGAAIALTTTRINVFNLFKHIDKLYISKLVKSTLPLTVSIIINLIYFRIDTLILPLYRGIEEVGFYNISYKIFENLLVIPSYFANALYPILILRYNTGLQPLLRTIKKSIITMTALSFLLSIVLYLAAPSLIYIVTGQHNHYTILLTRILTSSLFLFFTSAICMWSLIVLEKQKYLSYIYAGTMVLNITLNLLFIPQYGALASAWITLVTEAIVLLLSAVLLHQTIKGQKS